MCRALAEGDLPLKEPSSPLRSNNAYASCPTSYLRWRVRVVGLDVGRCDLFIAAIVGLFFCRWKRQQLENPGPGQTLV